MAWKTTYELETVKFNAGFIADVTKGTPSSHVAVV